MLFPLLTTPSYLNILVELFSLELLFCSPDLELARFKLAKGLLEGPSTLLRVLLRSVLPKLANSLLRFGLPEPLPLPTIFHPSTTEDALPLLDPSRCKSRAPAPRCDPALDIGCGKLPRELPVRFIASFSSFLAFCACRYCRISLVMIPLQASFNRYIPARGSLQ